MPLNDDEIIQAFKIEDKKHLAFNHLVIKYQKKVYWMVRRLVIDHDDTNDIIQEVFIKIWINLGSFRGDSQLYTWVYRIAVNESLTFLKRKKLKSLIPIEFVENEINNKIDNNIESSSDSINAKLLKSVAKLPEKQRLVFNLRYYEELTYEEMNKVLGTSVGALKASFHHAVKKIEEYIFQPD